MKNPDGTWKNGGHRIDMSGRTYGSWKVLERVGTTGHNSAWLCQCQCEYGELQIYDYNQLKRDELRNGCYACRNKGKRFGKLVVHRMYRNDMVECKCVCGNPNLVTMKYELLKSRESEHLLSCGCVKKPEVSPRCMEFIGSRFGKLKVTGFAGNILCHRKGKPGQKAGTKWKCVCDCDSKKEIVLQRSQLISGKRTHCGCVTGRKIRTHIWPRNTTLAEAHPAVARQWHPTKNGTLTPEQVSRGSLQKVWWICKEGHEWEAPITGVVSSFSFGNTGCSHCWREKVLRMKKYHKMLKTTKIKKAA